MTDESMPEMEPTSIEVTSIDYTLDQWHSSVGITLPDAAKASLRELLVAREENIKTLLSLAGQQFALYPEVVAEVLAQCNLGEPLDTATRALIHSRYHEAVNKLVADAEDFRRRHPDEPHFRQDERDV